MTAPRFRRRTGLKYALGLPLVFVSRGALADCGNGSELRIRCARDFRTFDPADAQGDDELIARNIFAPLLRYRKGNSGWEWDKHTITDISTPDNGKTFNFKLRANQPWIDGKILTVSDVKYSFERLARIKALNAAQWSDLDGVTVNDSVTGAINLKAARSDLLTTVLPAGAGCVVNEAYVEQQPGKKFMLDEKVLTTGRYSIAQLSKGDRVVLGCNPAWNGDPVRYTKVTFRVVPDDTVAQNLCAAGELDVYEARADELDRLRGPDRQRSAGLLFEVPTSSVIYLALATTYGPLASRDSRRALQLAVRPAELGRAVYRTERNIAATGLVASGWPGHLAETVIGPDLAEAKRLSASLKDKEVKIAIPGGSPSLMRVYETLHSQLAAAGIATSVVNVPPGEIFAKQIADAGLFFGPLRRFGAMAVFRRFSKADNGLHGDAYASAEYDSLLKGASEDGGKAPTLASLQRRLIQDGAAMPLVEHQRWWWLGRDVVPSFDPDGAIGDIGAWARRT